MLLGGKVYMFVILKFLEILQVPFLPTHLLEINTEFDQSGRILISQFEDRGLKYFSKSNFHEGFIWLRIHEMLYLFGQCLQHELYCN